MEGNGGSLKREEHTAYGPDTSVARDAASAAFSTGACLVSFSAVLDVAGARLAAATACDVALASVFHDLTAGCGRAAAVGSVDAHASAGAAGALEIAFGEEVADPVGGGGGGICVAVQCEGSLVGEEDGGVSPEVHGVGAVIDFVVW